MNQNKNLDNLLQQGHLLLERGQYETGLATFQEADNLFPNRPQVKYGLGLACFRLERFQQSVEYLTQALSIALPSVLEDPPSVPLKKGETSVNFAIGLDGKPEEKETLEVPPLSRGVRGDLLALVRRGMAYKNLKQTELANADFEAVLQVEAITHEDWRARGIAFDELKRSEEALEC